MAFRCPVYCRYCGAFIRHEWISGRFYPIEGYRQGTCDECYQDWLKRSERDRAASPEAAER